MELSDIKYNPSYEHFKTLSPETEGKKFDLSSPKSRRLYFNSKVGEELSKLREFLKNNTFIAYLAAMKMAGKGTYSKMLIELLGKDLIETVSVGDVVRAAENEYLETGKKNSELYKYVISNYRGFMDPDEGFEILTNRDISSVMPTEFVLTLVKRKIAQMGRKTLLLDGFPRKADQVNYSLYFRDLINFREDPDLFILINIPLQVINDRMKYRRVCPLCKTPRSLILDPTKKRGYDKDTEQFYIKCDNPNCPEETIMVSKEGDDKGVEYIKERLFNDYKLMEMIRGMYGVPKIELYNAVETEKSDKLIEEYELTHMYKFEVEEKNGKEIISAEKELYKIKDDGKEYYSLLPAPVVTQLIKQLVEIFNL